MKKINILLVAVILIMGVVGCGGDTEYQITWSPPKISAAVTPGGSWEGSMSFISSMDLSQAGLSIVPELETFVSVYPQNFSNITADTVNTFEMSIVIPPDATVDEVYDGTISLTVGGQDCPETLEVRLYTAPPLDTITEEAYNATLALEIEASELFWDTEEQSGTQEAQQITLAFLKEQTEVFDTGISESGSIWIVYKDGIHALISTSVPGTLGSGYQSEDMEVLDNAFMSTADSMTPGNTMAILLCPIFSEAGMQPLGIQEAMIDVKDGLEGIGYDTTPVYDDDVTVDLLKSLHLYGVVDFMTHGDVWSNQVVLMTGEEATFSSFRAHLSDWTAHRLARRSAIYESTIFGIFIECNWCVRPSFVTYYADEPYPNSIVVATACSSFANWSMADAFLGTGACVYAGWTDTTRAALGIDSKLRLYECLTGGMNLQEAFNTLVDEGLTVNPSRGERFFFYPPAAGDFVLFEEEEPGEVYLTITSTAGGSTTPAEGTHAYDAGTVVDLVATADPGYYFVSWTGNNTETIADVNDASTTITMNDDYSITANFEEVPVGQVVLTISSTIGGAVTDPGEGIFIYDEGTEVSLIVVAEETDYEDCYFVNWSGDVDTVTDINDPTTTITMNDNYSITANFANDNIAFGKPTVASSSWTGHPPEMAVDGSFSGGWNSGDFPPGWIEVDLQATYTIGRIRLTIAQYPLVGETVHQVLGKGPGTGGDFQLLHEFHGITENNQQLEYTPATSWEDIQFIRILTLTSPSWVAWREIEIREP